VASVNVSLNFLGVPVDATYVAKLRDGADHTGEFEYRMIKHVLELAPEAVPNDYLDRYVEASHQENYLSVFPHTDKIFERFLTPLKSAKRCYCIGEFLATVELSAHVGEMLALLVWEMSEIKINGKPADVALQKALWGREFEKLGQEQRIDILKGLGAISEADTQLMDYLRTTRRTYFHFWSAPIGNLRTDALRCFIKLSQLVKSILQIEFDNGALKMNPLLVAYIGTHPQPVGGNAA
jgi:hypothetical protein